VTYVPLSAMRSDLNPIEHIWEMLGRSILAREPPVQKIPLDFIYIRKELSTPMFF
jgi:hypothetical protein